MKAETLRLGMERQSSIETEPRTLGEDQIHRAREAALYVASSRSSEEAIRIFTAGLKPVNNVEKKRATSFITGVDAAEKEHGNYKRRENCIPMTRLKHVLSAPF